MLSFEDAPAIELVKTSPKGPRRRCRLSVDGLDVVTEAGPEGKALKASRKSFPSAQEARVAWDKAVREKLRDDFAFVRPFEETPVGGLLLCAFASGAGAGTLLDFSLDGRLAVTVGSDAKLTAYWVEVIEVATGARRRVFERTVLARQGFVHAVFFDAAGEAVYLAPQEETLRVDLATGAATRVAGYDEHRTARFNPFVVRPHADLARRRVVVFDAGDHVRVLDPAHRPIFSVCVASPTTECRAAEISPSGRLLALYRVSRGVVYNHDDARHDDTSVVEVWDVDAGSLRASLPMPRQVDGVGLSPDDATLLVSEQYAKGPIAYDLATGAERWRLTEPYRPDELAQCHDWAYSPDGSLLAVGHGVTGLYDAATRAPVALEPAGMYRTPAVRFSADGSRLASAEGGLCVVRRVR
ncbi:MAG: hypothetical protein U0324_32170 [Polyangiales bacterium]